LDNRIDWSRERKEEAFLDAIELRKIQAPSIDTSSLSASEVATKVLVWAEALKGSS
jgi:hypothetical protein